MEQEIRIIKKMLVYGIALLFIVLLENINSEKMYVSLNSPYISNNLVLTLAGGICTGITAVLLEKLFKYRLDKRNVVFSMYYDATVLYAEIHYWICNIKELHSDKGLEIPENLFANKIQMINPIIMRLKSYDYSNFWIKDFVNKAYEAFRQNDIKYINKTIADTNYFQIAIKQAKINEIKTGIKSKQDIYKVLSILENELLICEEKIENYIGELDKAYKILNWDRDKDSILCGYMGLYSRSLEDFINDLDR